MKTLKQALQRITKLKRKEHHPILHHVHKKHKISKKTLFYVKEYGPHTNIPRTIIRESIGMLFLASIISSLGGFALEHIGETLVVVLPLLILLPTLNDMIGDYGTILSSRFSTLVHEGKVGKKGWLDDELQALFGEVISVSVIMGVISTAAALLISSVMSYPVSLSISLKVLFIVLVDVILLVILLFFLAVFLGIYLYKRKEDPNNFLIPLTTSIADFGNMILLTLLVKFMF